MLYKNHEISIVGNPQEEFSLPNICDNKKLHLAISLAFSESDASTCQQSLNFILQNQPISKSVFPLMSALLANKNEAVREHAAEFFFAQAKGNCTFSILLYSAWQKEENLYIKDILKSALKESAGYRYHSIAGLADKLNYSHHAKKMELSQPEALDLALVYLHLADDTSKCMAAGTLASFVKKNLAYTDEMLYNVAYALSSESDYGTTCLLLEALEQLGEQAKILLPLIRKKQTADCMYISTKAALTQLIVEQQNDDSCHEIVLMALRAKTAAHVSEYGGIFPETFMHYNPFPIKLRSKDADCPQIFRETINRFLHDLIVNSAQIDMIIDKAEESCLAIKRNYIRQLNQLYQTVGMNYLIFKIIGSHDYLPDGSRDIIREGIFDTLRHSTNHHVKTAILDGLKFCMKSYEETIQILEAYSKNERDRNLADQALKSAATIKRWAIRN